MDPALIADVSGDNLVSTLDADLVMAAVTGSNPAEIPPRPAVLGPIIFAGADPTVSIPTDLSAAPGAVLTIPVNLDTAKDLTSVTLTLAYDPTQLVIESIERGSLTQDFEWFYTTNTAGQITLDASRLASLASGQGSLLLVQARVISTLAPGAIIALDLTQVALNDTHLTLTPNPVPGWDAADGMVQVIEPSTLYAASVDAPIAPATSTTVAPIAAKRSLLLANIDRLIHNGHSGTLQRNTELAVYTAHDIAPKIEWGADTEENSDKANRDRVVRSTGLNATPATATENWRSAFVTTLAASATGTAGAVCQSILPRLTPALETPLDENQPDSAQAPGSARIAAG